MADIADGETVEMKGSAAKPYQLKNTGGVYSCSCPAWRNQSLAIERRTCKHLRKYRGEEAEKERLGGDIPEAVKAKKSDKTAPPLLLAHTWDTDQDLSGWWMSEKLDGVRAYWDGKQLLSRQGNLFHAPDWFLEGLPSDVKLDGELWLARKEFQKTVSIARRQDKSDHWKELKYLVFDAPHHVGTFEERLTFLEDLVESLAHDFLEYLAQDPCKDLDHLAEELARVEALGGEGLMLRKPKSKYEAGKSSTLLKVKTFLDDEALVLGHQGGKGKHKGRLGALLVSLKNGTQFSVGTGFSDAQRKNPPEIGSFITFRYQELTKAGVPRFPSFVRERPESDVSAEHKAFKDSQKEALAAAKAPKKVTKKKAVKKKTGAKGSVESSEKKAPATAQVTPAKPGECEPGDVRYYEYKDEKSHKFWEVTVSGLEVTTRYGRIGSDGQKKTKSFKDGEKAKANADSQAAKKVAKGYELATND
ncbi:MAG: DNA ligase [Planctomycetota bacterium]|nr:DNA ligase [Planctomycetota bacterium]